MTTATYSIQGDVLQVQASQCALTAWHIDRGSVGEVDVSGLNLVAVSHDDGDGVRRVFFLNEDAGPEQVQVVLDLLQARSGPAWGGMTETARDVAVYQLPVEFGQGVKVPGRLVLETAAEGAELWVEIPELDLAWRSSRCAAVRARFQVEG